MNIRILNSKFFVLALLALCSFAFLQAEDLALVDSLKKAKPGDFVVSSQGKNFTLFHIFDVRGSTIVIEEISAPMNEKRRVKTWQNWIHDKAPGHISWVMYELDLATKSIEDMYSFSQKSWQKVYPQEQIFPTLIGLKFKLIETQDRKKAGPRPPLNIPDERSIWNPPVYLQGKKLKGAQCSAYQTYWPNDGTELAGKKVEIFLPQDEDKLPAYFPFWIQASNQFAQAKMRVIDSGADLKSIYKSYPTPPLELISHQFTTSGNLQFDLKTHPSFQKYTIYIRDSVDQSKAEVIPFATLTNSSQRKTRFTISNQDLNNKIKTDKLYYFIFEPHEHAHMSIETNKPIGIAKPYVH